MMDKLARTPRTIASPRGKLVSRVLGADVETRRLSLCYAAIVVGLATALPYLSPPNWLMQIGPGALYFAGFVGLEDITHEMPGRGERRPLLAELRAGHLQLPLLLTGYLAFLTVFMAASSLAYGVFLGSHVVPVLWLFWDTALTTSNNGTMPL